MKFKMKSNLGQYIVIAIFAAIFIYLEIKYLTMGDLIQSIFWLIMILVLVLVTLLSIFANYVEITEDGNLIYCMIGCKIKMPIKNITKVIKKGNNAILLANKKKMFVSLKDNEIFINKLIEVNSKIEVE